MGLGVIVAYCADQNDLLGHKAQVLCAPLNGLPEMVLPTFVCCGDKDADIKAGLARLQELVSNVVDAKVHFSGTRTIVSNIEGAQSEIVLDVWTYCFPQVLGEEPGQLFKAGAQLCPLHDLKKNSRFQQLVPIVVNAILQDNKEEKDENKKE